MVVFVRVYLLLRFIVWFLILTFGVYFFIFFSGTFYSICDYSVLSNYLTEDYFYSYFLSVLPVLNLKESEMTNLERARREFALIQDKFKFDPSSINYQDFQLFINGLYQAEGITGVYFPLKDSLRVVFYFSVGQNYSPEASSIKTSSYTRSRKYKSRFKIIQVKLILDM